MGKSNKGPDALSRSPPSKDRSSSLARLNTIDNEVLSWSQDIESQVCATAASGCNIFTSWSQLQDAGSSDKVYSSLLHVLQTDHDQHLWDTFLSDYKQVKDQLTTVDGGLLYKNRVVVPSVLQHLNALHKAHQETTSIQLRVSDSVWWPKISQDLARTKDSCHSCMRNSPQRRFKEPTRYS